MNKAEEKNDAATRRHGDAAREGEDAAMGRWGDGATEQGRIALPSFLRRVTASPRRRVVFLPSPHRPIAPSPHRSSASRVAVSLLFAFCLAVQPLCFEARAQRAAAQRAAQAPVAVELTPAAKAALDAAVAALQANALADAERAARAAVQAAPRSAITHNVLGVVLDRAGRAEQALAEFNAAIRLDANFVSAHNNLGRMLAEHGKTAEAINEFERVLKLDPRHVQAHYNLGALYGDAGEFVKATEHFAAARAAAPNDPQLALAFLNVAYRAGRIREADAAADLVEQTVGSEPRALFTLATALAQNKQYERAARVFKRVNQALPHTFEVLYNLGIALYNLDHNDEAAGFLAEAADLNPAPAETHFRLGLIASARNDHANAAEEFKHALDREANNANYHYML
ncbi:MAG TPA: tetratricopeptide repeat protein, partial [Blastocatellia bacterium]